MFCIFCFVTKVENTNCFCDNMQDVIGKKANYIHGILIVDNNSNIAKTDVNADVDGNVDVDGVAVETLLIASLQSPHPQQSQRSRQPQPPQSKIQGGFASNKN